MIRCITLYRRRDYKRQRTASASTFVPASYRPLFSGCHTILHRHDSDSESDSDESEFDDPAFWPEMFADEDSNNNDAMEMVGEIQDGQSTLVTKDARSNIASGNDNDKNTNRSIDTKNASNKSPGTAFDSPCTTRS